MKHATLYEAGPTNLFYRAIFYFRVKMTSLTAMSFCIFLKAFLMDFATKVEIHLKYFMTLESKNLFDY